MISFIPKHIYQKIVVYVIRFTYMNFVGYMTQYGSHVNPHFNSGDIITALFHVVDKTVKGGSINFYDGLDEKIEEQKTEGL